MADTGVVTKQLEIAGYRDIQFEQADAQVFVGKDLDDAAAFQLAIGPAGEVYREAGKLAEQRYDNVAIDRCTSETCGGAGSGSVSSAIRERSIHSR